jgi:integrase
VLRFRRLRERAGLGADARGEHLVLYSSRHTFLTAAASQVSAPTLGLLADHTDPRTTRRYLHVPAGEILAAGERVVQNLK